MTSELRLHYYHMLATTTTTTNESGMQIDYLTTLVQHDSVTRIVHGMMQMTSELRLHSQQ